MREGLFWELHRVKGNHVVHPSHKETEGPNRSSAKGWQSVGYTEARSRARMPSSLTGALLGSPGQEAPGFSGTWLVQISR